MKNKFRVGCAGFTQGYWKDFFFPEDLPAREHLHYYSRHLNAVEINSTFYRKPMPKTLERWFSETGPDFKFFIKMPKTLTHVQRLDGTETQAAEFCRYISAGLREKLAGFLFQLPASFIFNDENLARVLKSCPPGFLNVVEFRHASWWTEQVQQVLAEKGIIFSGVSYSEKMPQDVIKNHPDFLYYRLHGIPQLFKSEYSVAQLEEIAAEIRRFDGVSFIFFNNTWGTAGIKNALALTKILDAT